MKQGLVGTPGEAEGLTQVQVSALHSYGGVSRVLQLLQLRLWRLQLGPPRFAAHPARKLLEAR